MILPDKTGVLRTLALVVVLVLWIGGVIALGVTLGDKYPWLPAAYLWAFILPILLYVVSLHLSRKKKRT